MTPDLYCIDTSFFINGWRKHYGYDVFPAIWEHLDTLIYRSSQPLLNNATDGAQIFSCTEVFEDLQKQKDDLYHWAKARRSRLFRVSTSATNQAMTQIMARFRNFAATGGSTNASDPWVIAHAREVGAVVVTDEVPTPKQRATKPPKIPDVCDAMGVPWVRPLEFFRDIGIKFARPEPET